MGDLGIDIGRVDGEVRSLRDEVADLGKECLVSRPVEGLALACTVPIVDPRLQLLALPEERAALRRQIVHDAFEPGPELRLGHARSGQNLLANEVVESLRDAQALDDDTLGHRESGLQACQRSSATMAPVIRASTIPRSVA